MTLERKVLGIIAMQFGAANAISISGIRGRLAIGVFPDATPRGIKQIVRDARRRGLKIGSTRGSRETPPGYYMIETGDELSATVRPLLRQAVDQLRTVERLTGKEYYSRELAGQMKLF